MVDRSSETANIDLMNKVNKRNINGIKLN